MDSRHDPSIPKYKAVADPKAEKDIFGAQGNSGINFDVYDEIPVETSGEDCPPQLTTFDDIDLGDVLTENIKLAKYSKPTPVQRAAIPIVMKGKYFLVPYCIMLRIFAWF